MDAVYLDNASTSFPKPESVHRAVDAFARQCGASPGRGGYPSALEADEVIGSCRAAVARLLGASDPLRIAFSSGSTEALNWAIRGLLRERGDHAVVSSLEHNAVMRPLRSLEQSRGTAWTAIPCDPDGTCDPEDFARAIRPTTRLVCVIHASNVLGTVLPIAAIADAVHARGVPLLVDASQTAGTLPFSVEELGIDLLAFTGHKGLFGPPGTGGLYVRPGLDLPTSKEGGTGTLSESFEQPDEMPERLESGTPNAWGLAGLRAGVEWVQERGVANLRAQEQLLLDRLTQALRETPGLSLYGPEDSRRKLGILSVNVGNLPPSEVARLLAARFGVAVRAGLHCAPSAHGVAGTLRRGGSVRFGIGAFTTESDVDVAHAAVSEIASAAYRRRRVSA
jgi:cysteine desulfurase family protein